jgi:hypothetical protein
MGIWEALRKRKINDGVKADNHADIEAYRKAVIHKIQQGEVVISGNSNAADLRADMRKLKKDYVVGIWWTGNNPGNPEKWIWQARYDMPEETEKKDTISVGVIALVAIAAFFIIRR